MADAGELPQWLSWAAGALGIIIGTVMVRMGWQSRNEPAPEAEQGRVLGALVDSRTVSDLATAVEAQTGVTRAAAEIFERSADKLSDEIRNLGDEVRRLGNKLER